MGIAEGISIAISLANAGMSLLERSGAISALINKAQGEGRTTLTKAEWDAVIAMDDAARDKLQDAIDKAS